MKVRACLVRTGYPLALRLGWVEVSLYRLRCRGVKSVLIGFFGNYVYRKCAAPLSLASVEAVNERT
jgi:hypothetical protein